jgi:signal transduction histidine kinase
MIGEISAGFVHEIRNPLTSLKGFLQLMKGENSGNQKYIDIMESELNEYMR